VSLEAVGPGQGTRGLLSMSSCVCERKILFIVLVIRTYALIYESGC